ncbi:MAG: DNA-processing protein DprA [Candidatus Saccharibacteria bacterium]
MESREKIYANALNLLPELGPVRLSRLRGHFGSFEAAWNGSVPRFLDSGLDRKIAELVARHRDSADPAAEFAKLEARGIGLILDSEPHYPALLAEIAAPPPFLYIRGQAQALNRLNIAVVGTRKMTLYGKQAAWEIVSGLASAGIGLVSGLAFGVDAEALKAGVEAGAICSAVLASPLDDGSISPRSNFQIAQQIMKTGCLVSEYPLGASVQRQNFPIRNRIIAGLSAGTLVVEADQESGSLITAKYALEQNRLVFAVPGSIFSEVSRGTNALIRQGACPVSQASDILRELNLDIEAPIGDYDSAIDPAEQPVLALIGHDPVTLDELIRESGQAAAEITAIVSMLEMRGRIKSLGGSKYVRVG